MRSFDRVPLIIASRTVKHVKTREKENKQYTTLCIDISRNRVIMRGIWRQRTCRQCPIMRFDGCFVPSFLYFELYAISSIKLFWHQLYLYARQSDPMRVYPASRRLYLHRFYTYSRFVIFFFKGLPLRVLHIMMRLLYFAYSKVRTITLNKLER